MTAPLPKFVTGSILRHVLTMTAASSVGLAAMFAVDIVSQLVQNFFMHDKTHTCHVFVKRRAVPPVGVHHPNF